MIPKFGQMLVGVPVDLVKRGPLSALQLALRRGQKSFVFFRFGGLTPKPEVEIEN